MSPPHRVITTRTLALSILSTITITHASSDNKPAQDLTFTAPNGEILEINPSNLAPAWESIPSAPPGPAQLQLTETVVTNLTATLSLPVASLFRFGDDDGGNGNSNSNTKAADTKCKVFPGDADYPSKAEWAIFSILAGNALIETVPLGAYCFANSGVYDAARCQYLLDNWTKSEIHANDPTSIMSPVYQGQTCLPQAAAASTSSSSSSNATCTLGGFPSQVLNVTTVAQIQLAVNFARNTNLRLVIKNTGHDFLGKSAGAGALSIWTHHLKSLEFLPSYKTATGSYSGPAFRLGAGVNGYELHAAAKRNNVTAVTGECGGVGVAGGFSAGGGHSPLISKYGLGSDQVLSVDVVLPSGRFVTASETSEPDLFWALRGGGGGTFGVVTSMTIKAHAPTVVSGAAWTVTVGQGPGEVPEKIFWDAMYAYWRRFPGFADAGSYGYSQLFPTGAPGGYLWTMNPWLVPGMALAEYKVMIAPLLAEWEQLGFKLAPEYFEEEDLYGVWPRLFPVETVSNANLHVASRLFPRKTWTNTTDRDALFDTMRGIIQAGSALIQYNFKADAPAGTPSSSANSHWRDALWFAIVGTQWGADQPDVEIEAANRKVSDDWMKRLRAFGPGTYGNEGDIMEPNFGEAFFGSNYPRLLQIKRAVDPTDLFWVPTGVGSEGWKVQGKWDWLTTQTGRLCKL